MSVKNTNPSTFFGGTWVAWGTGRVPVGVDTADTNFATVEKTGGSNTHTHSQGATGSTVLKLSQIPAHNHAFTLVAEGSGQYRIQRKWFADTEVNKMLLQQTLVEEKDILTLIQTQAVHQVCKNI